MDFEKSIGKCRGAIIFAIVVIVLLIGLCVAGFFTQDMIISNKSTTTVQNKLIERNFVIFPLETPVYIKIEKDKPCDMGLISSAHYDSASSALEKAQLAIHHVSDSTEFEWEGELKTGDYLIWIQATNDTDTIKMDITIKYIRPIFYYLCAFIGLICLLLVLRIVLKVRRIGKIKAERREYLETPAPKNEATQWGAAQGGGQQGAPVSYNDLYGSSGGGGQAGYGGSTGYGGTQSTAVYQQAPAYSAADLEFFNNVDTSGIQTESEPIYEQTASEGVNPFEGLDPMKIEDPITGTSSKKKKKPEPELTPIYESEDVDEEDNIYLSIDEEIAPPPAKPKGKGKKESISTKKASTSKKSGASKGKRSKPKEVEEPEEVEDVYLSMDDFD